MTSRLSITLMAVTLPFIAPSQSLAIERWKASTFEQCDSHLHDKPSSYACYRLLARGNRSWEEGIRHLEGRLILDPRDHLSRLALATLAADVFDDRSEDLMRSAIDGLAADNLHEIEALARLDLFFLLMTQGRLKEAGFELNLAGSAADTSASSYAQHYVEYHRGLRASHEGDISSALTHYKRVEGAVFPEGDSHLQGLVLNGLGSVALKAGRYADSLGYFRRAAEVQHEAGDYYQESTCRSNMISPAARLAHEGGMSPGDVRAIRNEARLAALRGGDRETQAAFLMEDAQNTALPKPERLAALEKALAIARESGAHERTSFTLRYFATFLNNEYPSRAPEARMKLDEAIDIARRAGSPEQVARGLIHRANMYRAPGQRIEALRAWGEAFDAIEKVRDLQADDAVRAGFLSGWVFLYHRVAGFFLEEPGPQTPIESIDAALSLVERMRARALLDTLDAAGAPTGGAPGDLQSRRAEVLARIVRTQRGLMSPVLNQAERSRQLENLDRLETQEGSLRDEMARSDPSFATLRKPVIPSVAALQKALGPEEALLSFQLPSEPGLTCWLLAVTKDSARVFKTPDRASLAAEISLFLGLLERRDGSEISGAARLYRDLLGDALEGISPEITRLVIIPDGPLHKLPFDSLRAATDAEPLTARYEISLAPSGATWLRWAAGQSPRGAIPVLALADPLLETGDAVPSAYRSATLASGLRLGPLPRAREEARSMVASLGGNSRIVVGADATERFIKTVELPGFRMLHLAAHAVVDDQHPARTAVLLAPGADDEDGLLQIREIVNLKLGGHVVILSSCRSASGAVVEGEGVMGLARAFFRAGAVAVVGSLWPLRDEEAAALVGSLGRHLAEGRSVAAALAAARRDRIEAGAPAAAWSGLVVLGNGGFVPMPGGRAPAGRAWLIVALAAGLTILAAFVLLLRGRRPRAIPIA